MKPAFETLRNGTLLAVAKNPHLGSVAVLAGVNVGSRHEPDGMHGAAHFVEHVFFKGTKRRPTAKQISAEIESLGGDSNAYTDKEMTGFHVTVSKHDGKVGVDVVHDMLENALFRPSDIEKERPVIREEISMYDNEPNSNVWELSEKVADAGSGLEHRITGNVEDVSFSPARLKQFFHSWYVPSRTVVVLAGAVDDRTVAMARARFGSMKPKTAFKEPTIDITPSLSHGRAFVAGKTDRIHVVCRFPGLPARGGQSTALELLGLILGGYSSARLFQSLREDKSLCYGVGASHTNFSDVGSVYVSTSLDRPKFPAAMKAILKEVADVRKHGVREDELKSAKTHFRGKTLLHADQPMHVAGDVVSQLFTNGEHVLPDDAVKRVMRTKASHVTDAAREFLDPAKMHVAVCGPAAAKKEVLSILDGLM